MSGFGFTTLTGGSAGALDAIPSTKYNDGDIAYGVVNGLHLAYQMSVASGVTADNDLIIQPLDASDARWVKMVPGGAMSHVKASVTGTATLTDSIATKIIFNSEVYDALSEYDTTTGLFTAKNEGYYRASAFFTIDSYSWSQGDDVISYVYKNDALDTLCSRYEISSAYTGRVGVHAESTVFLEVDDTLSFYVYQNGGVDRALRTDSAWNNIVIDRLV